MFYYFPNNYTWSSAFYLALMAGGQFGEMERCLASLKDSEPNAQAWDSAWGAMAQQQEDLAASDLMSGYRRSAGACFLRASMYRFSGERQVPPGSEKSISYQAALAAFAKATEYMPLPIERVDVPSPDGVLPGYLVGAKTPRPAPVVIFYSGFDVVKELLYGFIREEFVHRDISCLIMDTPGVGEPLRLRNIPSRPDYEVPTRAIVDYLETRPDVDASRIGIMGISLGGYYAPRAAAFEPRIKACVAWGGIWDYGAVWERRWASRSKSVPVPFFQLPWVMGTTTMEEALERAKQWTLASVLPRLTQPFLILHGEHDQGVPVEDARKAFEAAGSTDKELRIFTLAEGGAEHVQADEPDAAKHLVADWFAQKLGTAAGR